MLNITHGRRMHLKSRRTALLIAEIITIVIAVGWLTPSVANARTHSSNRLGDCHGGSSSLKFENDYSGGNGQYIWADPNTPYTVFNAGSPLVPTKYCQVSVYEAGDLELEQFGFSARCLTVLSDHSVQEGSCAAPAARINLIPVSGNAWNIQFSLVTDDCIYETAKDSQVIVKECNAANSGDRWDEK